jgi:hypothetical protein
VEFPKNVYLNSGDYTIHIPKLGDVMTRLRFISEIPGGNTQRESILNKVDFLVNSNVIESLKGDFINIDNQFGTPLEKVPTANTLVNGNFITLEIPFYIVKKGYPFVTEPDIRISFNGVSDGTPLNCYFLVDYTLIEDQLKPTFFQRVRQVQDISVIGTGLTNIKIDTAFTGPVYQLYFTVQDLETGAFIGNITNVAFYMGANQRFNLSGSYLRYVESIKRYGGTPIDPVYLYSFALDPSNSMEASGQMNFSRLDNQRFEITLAPVSNTVKVTIWAQSHNFCYFNSSNCTPIFQTFEYTINEQQQSVSQVPNLPLQLNSDMINNSIHTLYYTNVNINNVFGENFTVSTDDYTSNVLVTSPGYLPFNYNIYNTNGENKIFIWPEFENIIFAMNDPQTNGTIMLLSNCTVYDQNYGMFLIGNDRPYNMAFDVNANVFVTHGTTISLLTRQTYTSIGTLRLSATPILYYGGYYAYSDGSGNIVQGNYFTTGTTTTNILPSGLSGSGVLIAPGDGTGIFTGSLTGIILNTIISVDSHIAFVTSVNDTGFTVIFPDNITFNDSTTYSSYSGTIMLKMFCNSSNVLSCSIDGYYFLFSNGILTPNIIYPGISKNGTAISNGNITFYYSGNIINYFIDSFTNFYLVTTNIIYKLTNTYYRVFTQGTTYKYAYENSQTHNIVIIGKGGYSDNINIGGRNYNVNYSTFLYTVDIYESRNYNLQITDVINYNSTMNLYNSGVFSKPINYHLPQQPVILSNPFTIKNRQYGSGTYTMIASSNISYVSNIFNDFVGPPSWNSTNPMSQESIYLKCSNINEVSQISIISNATKYDISGSTDGVTFTQVFSGVSGPLVDFGTTYQNAVAWRIVPSIGSNQWIVNSIKFIRLQDPLFSNLYPITSKYPTGNCYIENTVSTTNDTPGVPTKIPFVVTSNVSLQYLDYSETPPIKSPNFYLYTNGGFGAIGSYVGSTTQGVYNGLGGYYGEWFKIYLSTLIFLTGYSLIISAYNPLNKWYILGSNDDITWNLLHSYTDSGINYWQDGVERFFTPNLVNQKFSIFAIVVNQMIYPVEPFFNYGNLYPNIVDFKLSGYNTNLLPGGTVTFLSATPGAGSLALTWTTTNFSSGTTLTVYYSTSTSGPWTAFGTPSTCGAGSQTITALTNGTGYYIALVVTGDPTYTDYNTNKSVSNGPYTPQTTSGIVNFVSATPSSQAIIVNWTTSLYPTSAIMTVYYATASGGPWTAFSPSTTCASTSQTITGLLNGIGYYVALTVTGGSPYADYNTSHSDNHGPYTPTSGGGYTTTGLLGYWDISKNSSYPGTGQQITDISGAGYGINLTTSFPYLTYYSNPPQIYGFNNSSNFISPSWSSPSFQTNGMSMECLYNPGPGGPTGQLFTFDGQNNYLMIKTSSAFQFVYNNSTIISYGSPSTYTWYHITVTITSGGNVTMYINGTSVATSTGVTLPAARSTNNLIAFPYFGESQIGIAMARIYNIALSGSQVSTNYTSAKNGGIYSLP